MLFTIRVILSGILFVQFSFAETVLFYHKPNVKNAVEYMNTHPTIDDVAKMIAFARMDAKALVTIRKLLKEKGVAKTARMPDIELKGNKLTIQGMAHSLIIGNSEKLEITYNGEIIPLKNFKDIEQVFKDVESFFGQSGASAKFLFLKVGLGESAYALAPIVYFAIIAVLGLGYGIFNWWNSESKNGLKDWPFDVSSFGKSIGLKCESDRLAISCGNEKLTFYADESGHNVDYLNKKTKMVGTLTLVPEVDIPTGTGVFRSAFYENTQKAAIMNIAKVALGENGQRQLCKGSEFAEDLGPVYAEIAKEATAQSGRKDKESAVKTLKQLDSGSRSK